MTPNPGSLLVSLAVAAVLLLVAMPATPTAAQAANTARVVVIGDIHGAYSQLLSLLKTLSIADDPMRWTGGRTTLVQTGDYTDRGAAVRPVLDLLMALERQAPQAGGRAVILMGNHEAMNLIRLHQDVSPAAYAAFVDRDSEGRRTAAYERLLRLFEDRRRELGPEAPATPDRATWMTAHPPGFLEYVEAFAPRGTYGRWLRARPAAATIRDTLFVHGGLNPEHAERSVDGINRRVRNEIERFDRVSAQMIDRGVILPFFTFDETIEAARAELKMWIARLQGTAPDAVPVTDADRAFAEGLVDLLRAGSWSILNPDGPLWFRGFARWTDSEGAARIDALTSRYGVRRFVVGHTFSDSFRILSRFGGRVFLIDTGMLTDVYKGGRPSALELADGRATAVYLSERLPLAAGPIAPQHQGTQALAR